MKFPIFTFNILLVFLTASLLNAQNRPALDRGNSDLILKHTLTIFGAVELPLQISESGIFLLQNSFQFSCQPAILRIVDVGLHDNSIGRSTSCFDFIER